MPKLNVVLDAKPIYDFNNKKEVREWWHYILTFYGKFPCYGIFLLNSGYNSRQVFSYLNDHIEELDHISGSDCLIIALQNDRFLVPNYGDPEITQVYPSNHPLSLDWTSRWYDQKFSEKVAELFEIKEDDFPCLLLFNDIRSTKHVAIKLFFDFAFSKEDLGILVDYVFEAIRKSNKAKRDPIETLKRRKHLPRIKTTSKRVLNVAGKMVDKTFELAMETWLKTLTD